MNTNSVPPELHDSGWGQKLLSLYEHSSKHSQYQALPDLLLRRFPALRSLQANKHEAERWAYIRQAIDLNRLSVLDIGCNTGYFSFAALECGASKVLGYEGTTSHATFCNTAARAVGMHERFCVEPTYFDFDQPAPPRADVCLLLNVLHHLGDDFSSSVPDIELAKSLMAQHLRTMSRHTNLLVFQLGFNWKGDKKHPLFEHGTKEEMINYVRQAIASQWSVLDIGVAQRVEGKVTYVPLDSHNIARDDSLGEFLNRPLFLLKSREFDTANHT